MIIINLPAINRNVTLRQYINAINLAKQHPEREFKHGLTTWWSTTGTEILDQFRSGLNDRINQAIPYKDRATHD